MGYKKALIYVTLLLKISFDLKEKMIARSTTSTFDF